MIANKVGNMNKTDKMKHTALNLVLRREMVRHMGQLRQLQDLELKVVAGGEPPSVVTTRDSQMCTTY